MFDIEKYLPLNSEEKIMDLIMDVKESGEINMPFKDFINEVVFNIRKIKLQVLFRDEIVKIRANIKVPAIQKIKKVANSKPVQKVKKPRPLKQVNKEKSKKEKTRISRTKIKTNISEQSISTVSPNNIIGKKLEQVSLALKIDSNILVEILNKHNIDLNKSFTIHDFQLIKKDLNIVKMELLDNQLKTLEGEVTSMDRIRQKQKPSLGKEGNYNKLIYINTKT